jgi:hypothetical protein
MNEDGTPVATPVEPAAPVDNINSEEGGVTADEVAQVLNIKVPTVEEKTATAPEEEAPAAPEEPETPVEEPKVEEPKPEAPAEEPVAPSFALEIEDVNGNKVTINPDDDIEEALKDFEPKSNGQIFKIIADFMEKKAEAKAYAEKQTADKAEADQAQVIADIRTGWDNEIKKLQGEKRLPVVADGQANERLEAVYKFMFEENQKRVNEGTPPIQTIEDALDKFELKEKKAAEVEAARKAKEENRARGGLVGGSSAPASSSGPVYHAGSSANNATQALKKMGII